MNRTLSRLNLAGVLLLLVVCVLQWQANRRLNLDMILIEKSRMDLATRSEEQAKSIRGLQADLDQFRELAGRAGSARREALEKLAAMESGAKAVTEERDALRAGIQTWTEAVSMRDARIEEAARLVAHVTAERDETVLKFNRLVQTHNGVVMQLKDALAEITRVRTNATTGPAPAK